MKRKQQKDVILNSKMSKSFQEWSLWPTGFLCQHYLEIKIPCRKPFHVVENDNFIIFLDRNTCRFKMTVRNNLDQLNRNPSALNYPVKFESASQKRGPYFRTS